jgi:sugar transferase (PEP-CTERM/EpsH1 system associated)
MAALLYLVHRVPFPPDKGDRIRTFQFLRYLSKRCDVHLACLADEPVAPETIAELRRYCRRVAIVDIQGPRRWLRAGMSLALGGTASEAAFRSGQLRDTVRQWARETRFGAVLASASSMASYLRVPELADVPAIVDLIDVDSQKWYDYAASKRGPKAWLYALEGRRLRRLERGLARSTKSLVLISAAEAAIFRRFCNDGRVEVVGNGVDLDYFKPQPGSTEQGCVFLGALDYWPNVEGLCWFCQEVWPEVHRRRPQTTLSIVGRRPTAAVARLAELPGVKLVGQVPDVRPYVHAAAVSVVPLRIARGVQNKVLESLAMGKATLVSPQALEGLTAQRGAHLRAASTPDEWITQLTQLLDDEASRRQLGAAGRRHVEQRHHWNECLKPLGGMLNLDGTSLDGTSLDGTSLDGTSLDGTSLDGTSLDSATIPQPADSQSVGCILPHPSDSHAHGPSRTTIQANA